MDFEIKIMTPAERSYCYTGSQQLDKQTGFQAGGYLNFEEDCDASVALRELMDSGIIAPRTDNYFRPGEYEACIDRSLQRWNPAYWQARQARLSVREAKATKERER